MPEEEVKRVFEDVLKTIYNLYLKYGDVGSSIKQLIDLAYFASFYHADDKYLKVFDEVLKDMLDMFPHMRSRIALSIDKKAESALRGSEAPYVGHLMAEIIERKTKMIRPRVVGTEERLKRILKTL